MPSRVDGNQREIVAALRAAGCTVQHLHEVGHGCPDLLVGRGGENFLIEVKMPGKRLNSREWRWFGDWKGQVGIAWNVADALCIAGVEVAGE